MLEWVVCSDVDIKWKLKGDEAHIVSIVASEQRHLNEVILITFVFQVLNKIVFFRLNSCVFPMKINMLLQLLWSRIDVVVIINYSIVRIEGTILDDPFNTKNRISLISFCIFFEKGLKWPFKILEVPLVLRLFLTFIPLTLFRTLIVFLNFPWMTCAWTPWTFFKEEFDFTN